MSAAGLSLFVPGSHWVPLDRQPAAPDLRAKILSAADVASSLWRDLVELREVDPVAVLCRKVHFVEAVRSFGDALAELTALVHEAEEGAWSDDGSVLLRRPVPWRDMVADPGILKGLDAGFAADRRLKGRLDTLAASLTSRERSRETELR